MCNLYSLTKGQAAIVALVRAMRDRTGNMPPLPGIFPDMSAPVVRTGEDGTREMLMMRWGFPPPPNMRAELVTNVRSTKNGFWRKWLNAENRCLVPATSFAEWTDTRPKTTHWFALSAERPLFFFAGIWRSWTGPRGPKKNPVEGQHLLYSILTTQANDLVRPIHAQAMPVILTTPEECETWMNAPMDEALTLQRPLANDALKIVATGEKEDKAA